MGSGKTVFLGIDPGISGALAVINTTTHAVDIADMPMLPGDRRTEVSFIALVNLVEDWNPIACLTEDVWGVAGCGAKSSFNFGAAYGCLIGAFAYMRRPLLRVRPQTWQKAVIASYPGRDTKAQSVAAATDLYPSADLIRGRGRKPDHNRSDALCIAHFLSLGQSLDQVGGP